ncbi:MAG: NAD(P)-dependent oxidoreductase [Actinobacteria bacterium]|nr:MAG: NAD(P)-dependent oxidoreductase [Actinomycetota bacterium]
MARVAFIGLGTMGLPMARHLLRAGHDVIGLDLEPERMAALGGRTADSVAAAVGETEVAFTSLPDPEAVSRVVHEIAQSAPEAALFIDMSTGPPALARELARKLTGRGLDVLDAPVSGGPAGAVAASLTIMVGGSLAAFERAEPFLRLLGRPVHVGAAGAGQTAKLCNNLVAGVTMAALGEACAIAEREGIDAALLYELLTTSTGDSRVLRTRYPRAGVVDVHPSSNEYAPLFALDLLVKDLALALELADDSPVAAAALGEYRRAQAAGLGPLDYSAVYLVRSRPTDA